MVSHFQKEFLIMTSKAIKMKVNSIFVKTLTLTLALVLVIAQSASATNEFTAICYHDIPMSSTNDPHAVDLPAFIEQMEYMKSHGYSFVSPKDVLTAGQKGLNLPAKSVLMTFDDAYISFYSNVVPVLELYHCPALLAVCSSWIENQPPAEIVAPLMSWKQIAEISENPLVTVASHSFNLHRAVQFNPQSNTAHAATSRIYDPATKSYESDNSYRKRISDDTIAGRDILKKRTGRTPEILVWPYGEYNSITIDEAKKAGFKMAFMLSDERTSTDNLMEMDRWLIFNNPDIVNFIEDLKVHTYPYQPEVTQTRAVQADLDLIYDPDPVQTEKNLSKFLDRMVSMKPNTVYLQGFADPDGDGNVDAVYFPNRVLPMRMDLLSRVANQLYTRGFKVYIWMPTLAITLPDKDLNKSLQVMESHMGTTSPSSSWYNRLTPFSSQTLKLVSTLYEDLAMHVRFHGILFQDDAYLTDFEDFNPAALKTYEQTPDISTLNTNSLTEEERGKWTRLKTQKLNQFTLSLMASVRKYRPLTKFARNIYAPLLTKPHSEEWFCQNYDDYLAIYDRVVVMAYPEHEKIWRANTWLEKLVEISSRHNNGLDKTVFKIQAYNWKKKQWLDGDTMTKQIRRLVARGAKHVAYYPDNYTVNQPELKTIRKEMSTKNLLFTKPALPKPAKQY